MEKIFDLQSFVWWESDDIYKWPSDSFYAWENISIRKDLSWVSLSPILSDTWWSIDWNILCIVSLTTLWVSAWWIVVCTDTWKVYLDWVLKQTISTWTWAYNRVSKVWVMYSWTIQYIYYITETTWWNGKIHRSTTDLVTFNISYRSFATDTPVSIFTSIIPYSAWLYFATWNKVIEINYLEVVTDLLVLPKAEKITGFSQFQNNFRIYTSIVNCWIQYFWDWQSALPDYRQVWENQPILWIVNDWPYDYAILWFNNLYSDLYLISWTQKQELRVNLEASSTSRILDWYLSIREAIVYISWWLSWESNNYWIYSYGNYYPWTSKSLVQEYSKSTSRFTFHCHDTSNSYFVCTDWKVYVISHNNPPSTYATSWYLTSHFYQWNVFDEMTFVKMKVWFKLNTGEIKIYVRTDFNSNWSLLKTITSAIYNTKKWITIMPNDMKTLWLWNFYELQIKFELYSWTTWTKTPKLTRSTVWLNTLDNNK